MKKKIIKNNRTRLVKSAFRGKFLREPDQQELSHWILVYETNNNFDCFLKEISLAASVDQPVKKENTIKLGSLDALIHSQLASDVPYVWLKRYKNYTGKDVCVFVVYASNAVIAQYKIDYLKLLKNNGFSIFLIVALDNISTGFTFGELDFVESIMIRHNEGYDFAAWSSAVTNLQEVWNARMLVFANDSMFINSSTFDNAINLIRKSDFDVVGFTQSTEHQRHLQSYFLAFKHNALMSNEFREYWTTMKCFADKRDVIQNFEVKFTEFCESIGLRWESIFQHNKLNMINRFGTLNPLHFLWRELVSDGFPFVKVELMRDNPKKVNIDYWEDFLIANGFCKTSIRKFKYSFNKLLYINIIEQEVDKIKKSGQFDVSFYLCNYPDAAESLIQPIDYFCIYGWRKGQNPNKKFNVDYYLDNNPDVVSSEQNPFIHWLEYGQYEKRVINCVEIDPTKSKKENNPSLIFVSHEASQTGAPAVLISLMTWVKKNTDINFSIIVGAQGLWNNRFESIAPTFYMDSCPQNISFEAALRQFCGNNVQAIYVNTIASGFYANALKFLHAEYITHVHEMESVFSVFQHEFDILKSICNKYIAVSPGTVEALIKRVNQKEAQIHYIKPFIEPHKNISDLILRPTNKKIIFGCGAVETRKGFDLFCDIAVELKKNGRNDFQMYWIGSSINKDMDPFVEINKRKIQDIVEFLGVKECPRDYFQWGDIFLMTSREDPYPLVCMEAAECGMPIVCFDETAGGMFSFVEDDAGFVIPYLDIKSMVKALNVLLDDDLCRVQFGIRGKEKVIERHYVDVAAKKILALLPTLVNLHEKSDFECYRALIDRAKIVSFDIFDTLVIRKISNPNVVFDIVEYRHTEDETGTVPFFDLRMETAGELLSSFGGKVDDVNIDLIYDEMPFYRNLDIEKKVEISLCISHPLGIKLYEYACIQEKQIYITSDMYLDRVTIEKILRNSGIHKWDELFLSSEIGLKKDTGNLYQVVKNVAAKGGRKSEDILHIGDAWKGDVFHARDAGLTSIRFAPLYESTNQLINISLEKYRDLSQIGRIWQSYCTQSTRVWNENQPGISSDFYTKLGFELTGPFAVMMAIHTRILAQEMGVKKIVFMARDGKIIKMAFDKLYSKEISSGFYSTDYLYLSRATVVPATFEYPLSSSDLYFLTEGIHLQQQSIENFIVKAGIDSQHPLVQKTVKKYFSSLDYVPNWQDKKYLVNIFDELSDLIRICNDSKKYALSSYLEQHGILSEEKVIIVDVGWMLNIQSRLTKFIYNMKSQTKLIGSYVGTRERINKNNEYSSLLFEMGEPTQYSKFLEENVTLFEVLFSSPEPSVKLIELGKDGLATVMFNEITFPPSEEFVVAQKLHMGAEIFFDYFYQAQSEFFPEKISKDYFFKQFEALVLNDNILIKATLNKLKIALGGHHDFVSNQSLINSDENVKYLIKERDEYFNPIIFSTESKSIRFVIITSAGLDNGSTRYRALHFADIMQRQGISSTLIHSSTSFLDGESLIREANAVIFQRCFEKQGNIESFLMTAQNLGKCCIFELDDLVIPKFVSEIGSVVGGEWKKEQAICIARSYENLIKKAHACIVSTPLLKEQIEIEYGLKSVVVRNRVTPDRLKLRKLYKNDSLRLIYASGTFSHKEDFLLIENLLYQFLSKNKFVQLSILGATQVSKRILVLPNVRNYPLLNYDAMFEFIAKHDLMIVPLVDNIFNRAKSAVKFVECGAVGVPVLASRVGEFADIIEHKKNGFLASNEQDWVQLLSSIAEEPEQLKEIAYQAYQSIEMNYVTSQFNQQHEIVSLVSRFY
jgi:glycosyltransferase involved in cell wall biosynthesis/FMN phosphatase YigB (HAD superfamily)